MPTWRLTGLQRKPTFATDGFLEVQRVACYRAYMSCWFAAIAGIGVSPGWVATD